MDIKAIAKDTGLPARKVRLIADLVEGKKVNEALAILKFVPSPKAKAVAKTIKSAAASAENNYQLATADLKVKRIFVDKARHLKRFRAQARGRAAPILKRSSHITVIVGEQEG
jgi:large subunit ribosomal protein L22